MSKKSRNFAAESCKDKHRYMKSEIQHIGQDEQ